MTKIERETESYLPKPVAWARLWSDLFNPLFLSSFTLALVVGFDVSNSVDRVIWMVITVVLTSIVPILILRVMMRSGWIHSLDIVRRENRAKAFLAVCGCFMLCGLILHVFGLPLSRTLTFIHIANILLSLTITLFWKISIHSAMMGAAAIITSYFGWIQPGFESSEWVKLLAILFAAGVPVTIIARMSLGVHTAGQTVVGAMSGIVVTGLELWIWIAP